MRKKYVAPKVTMVRAQSVFLISGSSDVPVLPRGVDVEEGEYVDFE